MTTTTKKTISAPITILFGALLLCNVANSYHAGSSRVSSNRFSQSVQLKTIQIRNLKKDSINSFQLFSSISAQQSSQSVASSKSIFQQYIERFQSQFNKIRLSKTFQKLAVVCTLFLSVILGNSKKVYAAAAPLIKVRSGQINAENYGGSEI